MKIMHLCVGPVQTNCYIVFDPTTREGIVIDPGDNADSILANIEKEALKISYILLTHAHFDHIMAAKAVQDKTGAQLVLHKLDVPLLEEETMGEFRSYTRGRYSKPRVDITAEEGTQIRFADMTATYMHTPGHTPGSCVIMLGDCLFTGDTMFRHECGRCDLPGGDFGQMLQSLKRLHDLSGEYHVLPGHEGFSMLSDERVNNPYVQQALGR